ATFMPAPACSTQPMITSPMSVRGTPERTSASSMTAAPRSAALSSRNTPPKAPIGVRHALRTTASMSETMAQLYSEHPQHARAKLSRAPAPSARPYLGVSAAWRDHAGGPGAGGGSTQSSGSSAFRSRDPDGEAAERAHVFSPRQYAAGAARLDAARRQGGVGD